MKFYTKNGFSLVELLVVMAVIALLTGIVMPALSSSLKEAKSAQCMSQLRQMAIAAESYAANNDDFYPPAWERNYQDGVIHEWDISMVDGRAVPGLLWQGQGDARVQQCPSFSGEGNTQSPYSGYNYNASYIGGSRTVQANGAIVNEVRSTRTFHVRNAAECALFGDGEYFGGANKFMRSPQVGPLDIDAATSTGGTQGFRHNERTNVAFADGHVASFELGYSAQGAESDADLEYGFLSPDNSLYDYE